MARSERHWRKIEAHLTQWAADLDRARLGAEAEITKAQTQYYQRLAALRADIEQSLKRWDADLKALKHEAGTTADEVAHGIEDLRSRLRSELSAWQPELDRIKRTALDAKADARRLAEDLRERGKVATKRMSALKQTAGESWDEIKPAIERAWAELRPALQNAVTKFKESRPPEPPAPS